VSAPPQDPPFRLSLARPEEAPFLLALWEASVRATHAFLQEADLQALVPFVARLLTERRDLLCARDAAGRPLGFMGVQGGELEMLFVDPRHRGCGVGRFLLVHALDSLGVNRVDVNEQNLQAVGFYARFGFRAAGRSEVDSLGLPYPILHLKLDAPRPPVHFES
jgi:putative acetyltransferase